jgi:hypothetical protein
MNLSRYQAGPFAAQFSGAISATPRHAEPRAAEREHGFGPLADRAKLDAIGYDARSRRFFRGPAAGSTECLNPIAKTT